MGLDKSASVYECSPFHLAVNDYPALSRHKDAMPNNRKSGG